MKKLSTRIFDTITSRLTYIKLAISGVKLLGKIYAAGQLPTIDNHGSLEIGNAVFFRSIPYRVRLSTTRDGNIRIGEYSLVNSGVDIHSRQSIEIGANCLIGDNVTIYDTDFHAVDEGITPKVSSIKIGKNVWLSKGTIVLAGVEIGDHSVIGANSVVTRSLPSKVFAAGVPAKVIRTINCSDDFIRR